MLTNKAKEIVEEIKELKTFCMKSIMTDVSFDYIDYDGFKALGTCMKLLDKCNDYMVDQAEMMDEMDRKLDKLLEISERKGS